MDLTLQHPGNSYFECEFLLGPFTYRIETFFILNECKSQTTGFSREICCFRAPSFQPWRVVLWSPVGTWEGWRHSFLLLLLQKSSNSGFSYEAKLIGKTQKKEGGVPRSQVSPKQCHPGWKLPLAKQDYQVFSFLCSLLYWKLIKALN